MTFILDLIFAAGAIAFVVGLAFVAFIIFIILHNGIGVE